MRWAALALVACTAAKPPTRAPAPVFPQFAPFRLPHTFEPRRYRVRLAFEQWRFTGHIEIEGDLAEPLSLIWLHGVDLTVSHAEAVRGATHVALAASPPREDQVIGLLAAAPLPAGRWTLVLDYTGRIREHETAPRTDRDVIDRKLFNLPPPDPRALGVFRRDAYVYTFSEPIYARRIFPCIDEPDRKVPWRVTLDVPAGDIAVGNAPVVRETVLDAAHKRVELAESLPLPSYLVAFAVGPFDVVDAGRARVLVRKGHAAKTEPAALVTPRLLAEIEQYVGMPYPYPKLDLVAVPRHGMGAMENPGLITVDESGLESQWAASTIGHELAHQWFGNLVTPRWWNDIWLNESFAQWMADKLARPVEFPRPFFTNMSDLSVLAPAGDLEQLSIEAFSPFDRIGKGATLLAGFEAFLGEAPFRDSIRRYLARHAHGSVTTADFVAELGTHGPAFAALLDHALPTLEAHLECDATGAQLVIEHPLSPPVPVCVAYDRDGHREDICHPSTQRITLPAKACPSWVMPNPRGAALYKTRWSPLFEPLLANGWSSLGPTEKVAIFDELADDMQRLAALARYTERPETRVPQTMLAFVYQNVPYVPDDLRTTFRQWVHDRLAGHGHSLTSWGPGFDDNTLSIELLARTLDPHLAMEARLRAKEFATSRAHPMFDVIVPLAANVDPAFATQLVDATVAEKNLERRAELLFGLRRVDDIAALFRRERAKLAQLTPVEQLSLLAYRCEATARAELATLTKNPADFVRIDQCLEHKKKLDPAFRAWLKK